MFEISPLYHLIQKLNLEHNRRIVRFLPLSLEEELILLCPKPQI